MWEAQRNKNSHLAYVKENGHLIHMFSGMIRVIHCDVFFTQEQEESELHTHTHHIPMWGMIQAVSSGDDLDVCFSNHT